MIDGLAERRHTVVSDQPGESAAEETAVTVNARAGEAAYFVRNLRLGITVHGLSEADLERLRVMAVSEELVALPAETIPGYPDRYFLQDLAPGLWTVIGRVGNERRRAEQRVVLEDRDRRADLRFEELPSLSGRVSLDGQPLRDEHVLLSRGQDWAGARRFWTRHDGFFSFSDLQPGDYVLTVGSARRSLSVPGDADITVDLRSGGVEGTAHDPASGTPLEGAAVRAWPEWATRQDAELLGIVRTAFVDSQGWFGLGRLTEGAWTLEVGGIPGVWRAEVATGSLARLQRP